MSDAENTTVATGRGKRKPRGSGSEPPSSIKKAKKEWDETTSLKLIQFVRANPVLWQRTSNEYLDRNKKADAWTSVADLIKSDIVKTAAECQKRWDGLMCQFRTKNKIKPTGSAAEGTKPWYGLEAMQFVKDHVENRSTKGTGREDETSEQLLRAETPPSVLPSTGGTPKTDKKSCKTKEGSQQQPDIQERLLAVAGSLQSAILGSQETPESAFGCQIANRVEGLPEWARKEAKTRITLTLSTFEVEIYNRQQNYRQPEVATIASAIFPDGYLTPLSS